MTGSLPKYDTRCFRCLPVKSGIAIIDQCDFPDPKNPQVNFGGFDNTAMQIAIKTDAEYTKFPTDFNFTISVIDASVEEIIKFGGIEKFKLDGFLKKNKLLGESATCAYSFTNGSRCAPPFDDCPPCTNPQTFFDLSKRIDGSTFTLTGAFQVSKNNPPYPDGTIVCGQIALLYVTSP